MEQETAIPSLFIRGVISWEVIFETAFSFVYVRRSETRRIMTNSSAGIAVICSARAAAFVVETIMQIIVSYLVN